MESSWIEWTELMDRMNRMCSSWTCKIETYTCKRPTRVYIIYIEYIKIPKYQSYNNLQKMLDMNYAIYINNKIRKSLFDFSFEQNRKESKLYARNKECHYHLGPQSSIRKMFTLLGKMSIVGGSKHFNLGGRKIFKVCSHIQKNTQNLNPYSK